MKRRRVLAASAGLVSSLTGCVTAVGTQSATETGEAQSTPDITKTGAVDNHRITAVEVLTHEAVRRSTNGGHGWDVRVTLRLKPQDTETVTVYPIGALFIYFDADGRKLDREHKQIAANTESTPRTVTLSASFQPSEASTGTFHRYRIDLVHA